MDEDLASFFTGSGWSAERIVLAFLRSFIEGFVFVICNFKLRFLFFLGLLDWLFFLFVIIVGGAIIIIRILSLGFLSSRSSFSSGFLVFIFITIIGIIVIIRALLLGGCFGSRGSRLLSGCCRFLLVAIIVTAIIIRALFFSSYFGCRGGFSCGLFFLFIAIIL